MVLTLWFVTAAHPEKIIAMSPRADRGFGRKLLAMLNPRWQVTPIGQFSLNRSAAPSAGEFYIAAFPGISVIQMVLPDSTLLSTLDERFVRAIPAADVYACGINEESGFGGFAHWQGMALKRAFAAKRDRVYEDIGLVEPFERPFWAGDCADSARGIALPFNPHAIAKAAESAWLGFDPATSPDINVVGYAVDGRPEPKMHSSAAKDVGRIASQASAKLGIGSKRRGYDDYEGFDSEADVDDDLDDVVTDLCSVTSKGVALIRQVGAKVGRKVVQFKHAVGHKLRYSDRPAQVDRRDSRSPLRSTGSEGLTDIEDIAEDL